MTGDTFCLLPRSVMIVSKIFGAFPIDTKTFKYSKLQLLNTVGQLLVPVVQIGLSHYAIPPSYVKQSPYLMLVQMLFHGVISVANVGTKYVCIFPLRSYLRELHDELKSSDDYLRSTYDFHPNQTLSTLSNVGLVVLGVLMIPVYAARVSVLTLNKVSFKKIMFFVLMYWQNLTVCCAELQFVLISANLYYQFSQINEALEEILSRIDTIKSSHMKNSLSPTDFSVPFLNPSAADAVEVGLAGDSKEPELAGSLNRLDRRARNGDDGEVYGDDVLTHRTQKMAADYHYYDITDTHRILRDVRNGGGSHVYGATSYALQILHLRRAHMSLSDGLYHLNQIYTLQLFLSLGLCFCCTLLDINYEIFGYFVGAMAQIKYSIVFWILGYAFRFITIVLVPYLTCWKAKYAASLVSSIANRFLDDDTKEEVNKKRRELKYFMRQLLSYEYEFTACGFFALDMRLITSAIATGTTYMVILLQFHP